MTARPGGILGNPPQSTSPGPGHDTTNLPILVAGGGLQHGQHLAFRRDHNKPLCNLFVTMLQHLGIEEDVFGSSTGTLSEIAT